MTRRARLRTLRALDVAVIAATAPVWIPLMAAGAIGVAVESGRPVLYRQARIGRHGVPFTMLKFRSMLVGDNPLVPDASRITRVGRLLRRTSLDELPQLVNVLRGEMSLVGPRPILPDQLTVLTPRHRQRHRVLPGLSGPSQTSGRNAIPWAERFELDRRWANSPTIPAYLRILARTVGVALAGSGVDGHDAADPLLVDVTVEIVDVDPMAQPAPTGSMVSSAEPV